jgi:hypothetical protein
LLWVMTLASTYFSLWSKSLSLIFIWFLGACFII